MSASRQILKLSLAASLIVASTVTVASGFYLNEESVAAVGHAFAGAAATGTNAASEYYNPALASRFKHAQISTGATYIGVNAQYTGTVVPTGTGTAEGGTNNLVPYFHYVRPLSDKFSVAFGITSPFGLSTNYGETSKIIATKTAIMSMNFNPNIAYKVTPWLAVAVGADALHGEAEYNAVGGIKNKLSGWGFGYNAGILLNLGHDTRIGVSYRSKQTLKAGGKSERGSAAATYVRSDMKLPDITMLSVFHQFSPKLAVSGSVFYTGWDVFKDIVFNNSTMQPGGSYPVPQNWSNTWFFSLAGDYKINSRYSASLGVGYDNSPTNDTDRNARLPGANRWLLAFGLHCQATQRIMLDMAYQHLFPTSNPKVTDAGGAVNGHVKGDTNLFGVGVTINM